MTTATAEPIHDTDFEANAIGGILAGAPIPDDLWPDQFYCTENGLIFGACRALAAKGAPVNADTVRHHLEESGELVRVGGCTRLHEIADPLADVANVSYYAGEIIAVARKRELQKLGTRLQNGEAGEVVLPELQRLTNQGETSPTRRFIVEPFADVALLDIPKRQHLVNPFLPERGLAMIYGPKGTGKTEVALTIAVGTAAGVDVLGWTMPRARRVLFVDGELDLDDLRRRIAAICQGLNLDDEAVGVVAQNLFVASRDRMLRLGMRLGYLTDPAEQALLREALPLDLALLIFDNLSCLFGGEENDAAAWDETLMFLLGLKHECGVTSLFLHHSGKGGDQRGTSRREDNLDTSLRLDPIIEKGELTSDGIKFRTVWAKHRGFRLKDVPSVVCTVERDGLATRWRVSRTDDMRVDALVEEYGIHLREEQSEPSVSELHRRMAQRADDEDRPDLRTSRATVYRLLQRAVKYGLLEDRNE